MAVSAIARQSEDKIMRQAYQRRRDEIFFHNAELASHLQRAEKAEIENEKLQTVIGEKDALIAELQDQLKK